MECHGGALTQAVAEALDLEEGSHLLPGGLLPGDPCRSGRCAALDMSFFQAVLDGYSLFHDPEYVEDRLKAGVIFGAFVDGCLAGFVGEHHEGSMGMLEVFPPYRGHGLGPGLRASKSTATSPRAGCPFDQVIVGN